MEHASSCSLWRRDISNGGLLYYFRLSYFEINGTINSTKECFYLHLCVSLVSCSRRRLLRTDIHEHLSKSGTLITDEPIIYWRRSWYRTNPFDIWGDPDKNHKMLGHHCEIGHDRHISEWQRFDIYCYNKTQKMYILLLRQELSLTDIFLVRNGDRRWKR